MPGPSKEKPWAWVTLGTETAIAPTKPSAITAFAMIRMCRPPFFVSPASRRGRPSPLTRDEGVEFRDDERRNIEVSAKRGAALSHPFRLATHGRMEPSAYYGPNQPGPRPLLRTFAV